MLNYIKAGFIALFVIATLGASFDAKPVSPTLKTKVSMNSKSPEAIAVSKEKSVKIKLVLAKNAMLPLKEQKPKINIVPGESNADQIIRLAQEQSQKRQAQIAQVPQTPQVISVPFRGDFTALYQSAGAQFGIPWQILAAVHMVETGQSGDTTRGSYAGATGPMQFLPSTFRAYAVDGNADGVASIYSVVDAMYSAANYLAANLRTKGSIPGAIWQYNHSDAYVNKVLAIARGYGY